MCLYLIAQQKNEKCKQPAVRIQITEIPNIIGTDKEFHRRPSCNHSWWQLCLFVPASPLIVWYWSKHYVWAQLLPDRLPRCFLQFQQITAPRRHLAVNSSSETCWNTSTAAVNYTQASGQHWKLFSLWDEIRGSRCAGVTVPREAADGHARRRPSHLRQVARVNAPGCVRVDTRSSSSSVKISRVWLYLLQTHVHRHEGTRFTCSSWLQPPTFSVTTRFHWLCRVRACAEWATLVTWH